MRIQWTNGAKQNLKQIEEYIAVDNPGAAIDMVFHILNSVEALIDHPAMGRAGRVFNTRELIISDSPFIVPYRVKGVQIEVLRVLHASMQWPNSL